MSHNNSYPIFKKIVYHNRSYHSLGVNFRGWCLMKAVTEVCRLVGTKFATRIRACAEFQFKIPTKSVRMRGFSSQICANQPANFCKQLN